VVQNAGKYDSLHFASTDLITIATRIGPASESTAPSAARAYVAPLDIASAAISSFTIR
jgi:hypothetical protein